MKSRFFSLFLVLTLILAALAGCGADAANSSRSSDEDDEYKQLLGKGYYEVYDEDDDLVGYLRVTSSKLIVYDEYGSEEDSLRYDYNAKKELYTLDDGELFGCEEFTVEKNRRTLTLITEDEDEYTLEEIDKSELPSGGRDATSDSANEIQTQDEAESGYTELPLGCYAAYDGPSLLGYLKVTAGTIIIYYDDGDIQDESYYSYDRNGNLVLNVDDPTYAVRITYERGSYYMSNEDESLRLEPISESEIPVYGGDTSRAGGSSAGAYYIGDNGSIGLYAWLPGELYDDLYVDYDDGGFSAEAVYYDYDDDYDAETALMFYAVLASDDYLQGAVLEAFANYDGAYSSDADLLYCYLRDSLLDGLDNGYLVGDHVGDRLQSGVDERDITINGLDWRCCVVYAYNDDIEAYLTMCFWMEGDNMATVMVVTAKDLNSSYDIFAPLSDMVYSLELYA